MSSAAWFGDGAFVCGCWAELKRNDKSEFLAVRHHLEKNYCDGWLDATAGCDNRVTRERTDEICRNLSQCRAAVQFRFAQLTRSRYLMARRRERKGAVDDCEAYATSWSAERRRRGALLGARFGSSSVAMPASR